MPGFRGWVGLDSPSLRPPPPTTVPLEIFSRQPSNLAYSLFGKPRILLPTRDSRDGGVVITPCNLIALALGVNFSSGGTRGGGVALIDYLSPLTAIHLFPLPPPLAIHTSHFQSYGGGGKNT